MLINDKWKYHVALWVAVIILGLITDYGSGGLDSLAYSFSPLGLRYDGVYYTASIIIYYINFKYICPRFLAKKRVLYFILSFIGLLVLFAGIRYFLDEIVFKFFTGTNNYRGKHLDFTYYLFDNIPFALQSLLFSTVVFLVFRFVEAKNEIMQLQLNHKKAELSFLKSQISPHFLFNTLNSFYSELIEKQPKAANDIHKLSELLRFVIYESGEEFVSLKNEISFVNDYIYFYKKRFENELSLDFILTGETKNQKIASLVLMHFIENVFKHGVLNEEENPARIEIQIEDASLIMRTQNKIEPSKKYMDSGIGVENLKLRLDSIYAENYTLNYSEANNYFKTFLKIPL